MSDDRKRLTPETYTPPGDSPPAQAANAFRPEKWLWLVVGISATLVLAWMISLWQTPSPPVEVELEAPPAQTAENAQPEAPSPFQEAAAQQAREDAQERLSALLDLTSWLQKAHIEQWAPLEFQQLKMMGSEGDRLYEARDYAGAISSWDQALASANQLRERAGHIAEEQAQQARSLLEQGNIPAALESIEMALTVKPDNADWQALQTRINLRPQLQQRLASANRQIDQGDLQGAIQMLEPILDEDSQYHQARETLTLAREQLADREFAGYMAEALMAIDEGRFEAAERAMEQASNWRADNSALQDARLQLASARHDAEVVRAISTARRAEQEEKWSLALAQWENLEALSPGSTDARVGQIRASAMLELDTRLSSTLADPLGLREEAAWQAAERLLQEALAVREPGPLLGDQINRLRAAIRNARTPVRLVIQSDGLTDIRINGVGRVGKTQSAEIELYPGRYRLVGSRSGYRDTQLELELDGTENPSTVRLIATEPVTAP